jgi:hypothetical protein
MRSQHHPRFQVKSPPHKLTEEDSGKMTHSRRRRGGWGIKCEGGDGLVEDCDQKDGERLTSGWEKTLQGVDDGQGPGEILRMMICDGTLEEVELRLLHFSLPGAG